MRELELKNNAEIVLFALKQWLIPAKGLPQLKFTILTLMRDFVRD
jgi:hypothetical protein